VGRQRWLADEQSGHLGRSLNVAGYTNMTAVVKQRLAIVILTVLLLGGDFAWPRAAAAVVGIVFFCWLVGHFEGQPVERAAAPPPR